MFHKHPQRIDLINARAIFLESSLCSLIIFTSTVKMTLENICWRRRGALSSSSCSGCLVKSPFLEGYIRNNISVFKVPDLLKDGKTTAANADESNLFVYWTSGGMLSTTAALPFFSSVTALTISARVGGFVSILSVLRKSVLVTVPILPDSRYY